MNPTLYLDQWEAAHSNKLLRVETDKASIVKTATAALSDLHKMLLQNMQGIKSGTSANPDVNHFFNLSQNGSQIEDLYSLYRQRVGLRRIPASNYAACKKDVDAFTASLKVAIDKQEKFIANVTAGLNEAGRVFIDRADSHMSSAKLFSGVMCKDCNEIVNSKSYNAHLVSQKCMIDTTNKDVRTSGYVALDQNTHISALQKSGINFELRPSGFVYWVPDWVQQGIQQWEGTKGGFGGLSLADYLTKIKPEENV